MSIQIITQSTGHDNLPATRHPDGSLTSFGLGYLDGQAGVYAPLDCIHYADEAGLLDYDYGYIQTQPLEWRLSEAIRGTARLIDSNTRLLESLGYADEQPGYVEAQPSIQ